MKRIIFLIIFLSTTTCFADDYFSYENKMKRRIEANQKEIEHNYRMQELELQHKIYTAELEFKKTDINIKNSIINKNSNRNKTKIDKEDL